MLLSTSALAAPQDADLSVLAVTQSSIPGTNTTLLGVDQLTSGTDVGWAARGRIAPIPGASEFAIIGDPSADGSQGVSVLRRPTTVGTFNQRALGSPQLFGGQLAYVANDFPLSTSYISAWIGDALIAQRGDAIGTTGQTWNTISAIYPRSGGKLFLRGSAMAGGGLLYAVHTDEILLANGSMISGLAQPITRIERIEFSDSGAHWAARVQFGPLGRKALLVDGQLASVGTGTVVEGRSISAPFGYASSNWADLFSFSIADDGQLSFQATVSGVGIATVQGDRLVGQPNSPLTGLMLDVTPEGGVLNVLNFVLGMEGQFLFEGLPGIDANGDGVPDAGYTLGTAATGTPDWSLIATSSGLIGTAFLDQPGSTGSEQAILRVGRGVQGTSTCDGVANSTGRSGSLFAVGRTQALANDLELHCLDLPSGSMGYALASTTSGFAANPGGSDGNLCLGGSVGRVLDQVFAVGNARRGFVVLDLTAIPQPTGFASVAAGDIYFFQVWHRDVSGTSTTSNFSNAIRVEFTN